MRLYARIALLIGGYLLVGGLVYGGTDRERIGLVLLLVAGSGFAYLGLHALRAIRAADRGAGQAPAGWPGPATDVAEGPGTDAEPGAGTELADAASAAGGPEIDEVRPTIWPLVFSLAGAGIVAGVLASHWILLAGGALAVAAAAGWFREALAQRQEHH